MGLKHFTRTVGASAIALTALAGSALADGYGSSGTKDAAPADEGRKLTWSITLGATSDYVFRGVSLSDEKPAAQGSFDIGYGIFYAGVWGSNLDDSGGLGHVEVDVYGGIKPVVGPVTFDLGIIGYLYPNDDAALVDAGSINGSGDDEYLEFKAGASIAPITNGTLGVAVYYSPDYQFNLGEAWAVEGTAGYTFRQVGPFVPTLSGTFGYQYVEDGDFDAVFDVGQEDSYLYWNVGLALAVDKFTIDLRYWDSDIDENNLVGGLADERFVGSVKVTLP
jgi:uncharacterized protein (TIGR02001 family)